ncbi:hypothetical protein ACHAW5_005920 [Stephanodiscus triporus]|uniref:Endoplasmic reticulum vesicle transporter C-terminal domain-containing protein n=1 Tax=Stephanodiscus triporus TaxID=2934178 RepID=A0ABD3P3F8_9STRA
MRYGLEIQSTTNYVNIRKRRGGNHSDLNKFISFFFVAFGYLWFRAIISSIFVLDEEILRNVEPSKTAAILRLRQKQGYHSLPKYPIDHRHLNTSLSDRAISQCHNALWHTLETTTTILPNNETFVITGDIPDLWLRDSAAQIHPLLIPNAYNGKSLVQVDAILERVVSGLILKTARYIRYDSYANAFKIHDHEKYNDFDRDVLGRHGYIATWNYELDSACYFMRMIYFFHEVKDAVAIMVDVWIAEQRHEDNAYPNGTLFDCIHCGKPYRYNPSELERGGKGTETAPSIGLTWSGFRPSDDPCKYGYLIPANMFAVAVLKYMEEMAEIVWIDEPLMKKARKLREEIDDGIKRHGVVEHKKYGKIYAYEVDGLGNALLEDDANIPSLLSIPYLGYDYHPKIFANTKRFILSDDNPWFHSGNFDGVEFSGIGSRHTQFIESSIWPMAMIMEGLTSSNSTQKAMLVEKLLVASAGTGWMHESFSANNPKSFSRPWFCWPDSLFAELVMSLTEECPTREHGWYKAVKQENTEKVPTPYCGYCYGAAEHEGDCCNTCDDVLAAHKKKGLDLEKVKLIARQCKCGSCFGAHENEGDCCNTCDDLLAAYKKKNWDASDVQTKAEQCAKMVS